MERPWQVGLRNVAFFNPGPAGRAYLRPPLEQTQTQMAGKAGLWCAESERMEMEGRKKRTLSEAQEEWSPEELASKVSAATLWLTYSVPIATLMPHARCGAEIHGGANLVGPAISSWAIGGYGVSPRGVQEARTDPAARTRDAPAPSRLRRRSPLWLLYSASMAPL